MADVQDVYEALVKLEYAVDNLPQKILLSANQVVIVGGLSDLSENLGLISAGEFRAGNQNPPGSSFSGMRMAYPAMTYGSELWNLVGVENDVLQFGVSAVDGKLYAGGGAIILDADGIKINTPLTSDLDASPVLSFWGYPYTNEDEDKFATIVANHQGGANAFELAVAATPSYQYAYLYLVGGGNSLLTLSSGPAGYAHMQYQSPSWYGAQFEINSEVMIRDMLKVGSSDSVGGNYIAFTGIPSSDVTVPDYPPDTYVGVLWCDTSGNLWFKNGTSSWQLNV